MSDEGKSALQKVADRLKTGLVGAHTPAAANSATIAASPAAGDEADLFADELRPFEDGAIRPPKRRAGRPPGSPNRTTLQLQRLLMARGYRDPAEFLAAIVSMDARSLAAAMKGGEASEATVTFDQAIAVAKLQRAAAEALMPYFHQKMPTAAEARPETPRTLIVMGDLVNNKTELDQTLKRVDAGASHDNPSHETPQHIDISRENGDETGD